MSLFTKISAVSNRASLPSVPPSDIRSISGLEDTAYEHWIFDQSAASVLTGRVNGKSLTPQGASPIFSQSGILVDGGVGSALLTDIPDASTIQKTFFCVFKTPSFAGSPSPLFGTYAGTLGFMLSESSGSPSPKSAYLRGSTNANPLAAGSFDADVWRFSAMSLNAVSGQRILRVLTNSSDYFEIVPNFYSASGNAVALGNGYYGSGSAAADTRFAEFGVFDGALSQADLEGLYVRAKERMSARGIAIA